MTTHQAKLIEEVARLAHERGILLREVLDLRGSLTCSRRDPEYPDRRHGPAKVCVDCFEAQHRELAKAALVTSSLRSLVHSWMQHGKACPFCDKVLKHSDTCYLSLDTGDALLAEYRAIEEERDRLLAATSCVEAIAESPASSSSGTLKSRFRQCSLPSKPSA